GGFLEDKLRSLLKLPQGRFPLTTIVFGQPAAAPRAAHGPRVDFRWIDPADGDPPLPFHLGMAQAGIAAATRARYGGRAHDPLVAYDRAVSETIERVACERHAGVYSAAFCDLARALDPRSVVAYDPRQYRTRGFRYVPFDERGKFLWKDGVDYF